MRISDWSSDVCSSDLTILPERVAMDGFEVDHDFPVIGHRIMLLNARKVLYDESDTMAILLAFRDVTERRAIEQEKEALLKRSRSEERRVGKERGSTCRSR